MSGFLDYEQLKYYDLCLKDVLKVWQKNYPYFRGNIVQYMGKYLECIKNGTSDKTVSLDINNASIGDTIADNDVIWEVIDIYNVIVEWKPNKTYYTDNICIYRGKLYRAKNIFTSGENFLPSHWELISSDIRPWFPFEDSSIVAMFDFEPGHYIVKDAALNAISSLDGTFSLNGNGTKNGIIYNAPAYSGACAISTDNINDLVSNDLNNYRNTDDFSIDVFVKCNNLASRNHNVSVFNVQIDIDSLWTYVCFVYDSSLDSVDVWKDGNYVKTESATGGYSFDLSAFMSIDNLRIRKGRLFNKSTIVEIPKDDYANPFAYRNTPFYVNDFCEYKGALYKCIADDLSDTAFDADKWQKVSDSGTSSGSTIKEWEATTKYEENSIVLKDNCFYRCLGSHTSSGDFANDIANWQMIYSNILEWAMKTYYPLGIVVMHDGALYQCIDGHTSTALFDQSKFALVETATFLRDWTVNTYYKQYELVLHDGKLYRAESSHTSGTDFDTDLTTNALWLEIYLGGGLNYAQIDAIGAVAPKQYNVALPYTNTFLLPPVEALKFKAGSSAVTSTLCDFNAGDSADFEKNDLVEFNGVLRPKTVFEYKVGIPTVVNLKYLQSSDWVDANDFKSISSIYVV